MKLKVNVPMEIEINYQQAIDVLKRTAEDITEEEWDTLSFSDIDRKVYCTYKDPLNLTEEEHEFVGAILKLVQVQEDYDNPLVL